MLEVQVQGLFGFPHLNEQLVLRFVRRSMVGPRGSLLGNQDKISLTTRPWTSVSR